MKSKLLFLMLAAGLLCFPAAARANMKFNPGFEIDVDSEEQIWVYNGTWIVNAGAGDPDGWALWGSGWSWGGGVGSVQEFITDDPAGARTGSNYFRGRCDSAGNYACVIPYDFDAGVRERILLESWETYLVGIWAKDLIPGGSSMPPVLEVGYYNEAGTRLADAQGGRFYITADPIPADGQYHYFEGISLPYPDPGYPYLNIVPMTRTLDGVPSESDYAFDDMFLGPAAPPAVNIYPPSGAQYIPLDAVLEWGPPEQVDPNAYDVYFTTDPNCNKPEHLVLEGKNQTTYDPPGDLEFVTTYYWRVNLYDPNCINACQWPNRGIVWSFTTIPPEPVFTTDAAHTVVAEGDSAVFSVVSPNADSFQWYREPATALNDGDDGGDISIVSDATTSTLTIDNVNKAADEDFYYCVATNIYDTTESTHAKLAIKELLAHWTMDAPLVANQYKDETGNHHADPNKYQEVSFTTGISDPCGADDPCGAVEMNNFRWANAGSWRPNEYGNQMTVSAWFKIPDTNDITGDGQGIVSKRVGDSLDWAIYVRSSPGDSHPDDSYVRFSSWEGSDAWGSLDALSEQWVFVAATVDGAGAGRLYVNGVVQEVDDDWYFGTNVGADILIGKGNPEQYVFPGLIDDVKIYNYARDNFEIAADYTDVAGGSVCAYESPVDYNGDCKVDLADVAEVALIWRNCNIRPPEDCLLIP